MDVATLKVFQGDTVSEKKPFLLPYHSEYRVPADHLGNIKITIVKCSDPERTDPPTFADGKINLPLDDVQRPFAQTPSPFPNLPSTSPSLRAPTAHITRLTDNQQKAPSKPSRTCKSH